MRCARNALRAGAFLWVLALAVLLSGCAGFKPPPVPTTGPERYLAAEAAFLGAARTVLCMARPKMEVEPAECIGLTGMIAPKSPTAIDVGSALTTARMALDLWGSAPADAGLASRTDAAILALQNLILKLKGGK